MKLLHIIGRKNSGKTTLIEELIKEFARQGLQIGTIKHTHHHHELDTPGKDSHRHRVAGAAVVGILAPGMTAVFKPTSEPNPQQNPYEYLLPSFKGCDLILVEGHVTAPGKKIEVWRTEVGQPPYAAEDPSILAVVSDDTVQADIPVWPRNNIAALCQKMLKLIE